MKTCKDCGQTKTLDDFYLNRGRPVSRCKLCYCAYRKRLSSPEKERRLALKSKFGISPEIYLDMLVQQNNGCAICGETTMPSGKKNLTVDHCHQTSKVRGLLCHNCNLGLGHFKDSTDIIKSAILYLQKHA